MTSLARIETIAHLTNNICRAIKTKSTFLGRECELLSENPNFPASEVAQSMEKAFDRVVALTPPKTIELASLKAVLKLYGWMDLYNQCDLRVLSLGIAPDFASLVQKIDLMATKIPSGSNQSSPLRIALQKLHDDYDKMPARQFYDRENLQTVQKLLSFLIIDQRVHTYLESHHVDVFFDYLCLKQYGATNVKKNSEGLLTEHSTKLPESIRHFDIRQKVTLAQELTAINFGLGLIFTALLQNYSSKTPQNKDPTILISQIPTKQALDYCRTLEDALKMPDLKPLHRDYLVYSFKSIFTRLREVQPSERLLSILTDQMETQDKRAQVLGHGIEQLLLTEIFEQRDAKIGKHQIILLKHEEELEALERRLVSAAADSPERQELEDQVQKKKSLLEILDFFQMSINHLIILQGDLEGLVYSLPEYQKLYDLLLGKLYETKIQREHRIASLDYRRPVYEEDQKLGPAFPKLVFSTSAPTSYYVDVSGKKESEPVKVDKKEAKPKPTQNETPVKTVPKDLGAAGSYKQEEARSLQEASELIQIEENPQKVQLTYASWASDWFTDPEKALERPQYASIRSCPKIKAKVQAYHTFPLEIDQFIFSHGVESSRPDSKTGELLKHYSIPCEIEFWNDKEVQRGSIGYCANQKGEYFHRCFSKKAPNEMVAEFIQQGFWTVDFPSLSESLERSGTIGKSQKLLNPPSRVSQINSYTTEIIDHKNQATIRIFKIKQGNFP